MSSLALSLTVQKLRSQTARNGAKMITQVKNGTKSGERSTDQAKKLNGATNGKQRLLLASEKEKTGDKPTQMTTK